jgi:NAD(P)-dependent dehydrogenase (short-subunit alcohol dehydrogenase family)
VRTVLITGAASGIGAATARHLCETWRVILADRDAAQVTSLTEALRNEGHDARSFTLDVASAGSVSDMMGRLGDAGIAVDALFSNAGIGLSRSIEQTMPDEWRSMMNVHVKGAFLCAQAVLPQMVQRRTGAIVMMASDYSVRGMKSGGAYAAAKAAIYSLAKSIAVEFASSGIRCNCVGPGPIETPLLRAGRDDVTWEEAKSSRASQVPMGRLGRPEEVAGVVDFLLSDDAAYITGQIIHPNGGQISW